MLFCKRIFLFSVGTLIGILLMTSQVQAAVDTSTIRDQALERATQRQQNPDQQNIQEMYTSSPPDISKQNSQSEYADSKLETIEHWSVLGGALRCSTINGQRYLHLF